MKSSGKRITKSWLYMEWKNTKEIIEFLRLLPGWSQADGRCKKQATFITNDTPATTFHFPIV